MSSFTVHGFLIALSPSHAAVITPSVILFLWKIASTINTTWIITDSSLLYKYWYLACPEEVQEYGIVF